MCFVCTELISGLLTQKTSRRDGPATDLGVVGAWKMGYSGEGVTVTVIDDGEYGSGAASLYFTQQNAALEGSALYCAMLYTVWLVLKNAKHLKPIF